MLHLDVYSQAADRHGRRGQGVHRNHEVVVVVVAVGTHMDHHYRCGSEGVIDYCMFLMIHW